MSQTIYAEAFWVAAANRGELRTQALPPINSAEVRVQTLYSAISKGTESLVFTGCVPDSEIERMRAPFQEGDFPAPVKYGYCNVGRVIEGADALIGKTVFCLYPHQTFFQVPEECVTPVPENIPAERAVLAANMETAVNALWDAQPSIGDRISVIGAGVVGLLVAYLASRIVGCTVQLIDTNPERQSIAHTLGIAFSNPDQAMADQDLIVHASGSPEGLNSAIDLAGFEARIIELSWFGTRQCQINLGGAFHSRRLQLRASQVGHVASQQRSRWNYSRRLSLALDLLTDERLDALINAQSSFGHLPQTMSAINQASDNTLCHRISYAE